MIDSGAMQDTSVGEGNRSRWGLEVDGRWQLANRTTFTHRLGKLGMAPWNQKSSASVFI